MIRQSKCNILWIDKEIDRFITNSLKERYRIDTTCVQELFSGVNIIPSDDSISVTQEIMMYGLSESRFLALHASIFSGPRELAGIYRSIVMKAGNNQFVDFWEIKNEMNNLFSQKYKTAGEVFYWMIEVLGRIHPFIDMNRRTIFLAADAHLLYLGLNPINWGKNRDLWENACIESNGVDAKKRLNLLMISLFNKFR